MQNFLSLAFSVFAVCFCVMTAADDRALKCLADNAYFEATPGNVEDRIAVTWVVLNRANSLTRQWPADVCAVVYDPSADPERPAACQFSWTCDGRSDRVPHAARVEYEQIVQQVRGVLDFGHHDPTFGATHYLRCEVQTTWRDALEFKTKIGEHCFYG